MADDWHIVIPARLASTRLPDKVLADLAGKPVVQRVWERAIAAGPASVCIATDSDRIASVCEGFGAEVEMTRSDHQSGSDRIAEVAARRGWQRERIVNVQGDEPFIPVASIRQVAGLLDGDADIATLCVPIDDREQFEDPNCVKVVCDANGFALLFSRAPIPYPREDTGMRAQRHVGIYGYRADSLARMVAEPPCDLELTERLEQLRALWLGMRIRVEVAVEAPPPGIDTEADLAAARERAARG